MSDLEPYIHQARKIVFNSNSNLSLDSNIKKVNDSNKVINKLNECIRLNNFEEFKKIYITEYLFNSKIHDYFKYEDENNNNLYNTYSLCTCINNTVEPYHKNMNIKQCNCINGKRYFAFLSAFNNQLGCICYDTNPKNLEQSIIYTEIMLYLLKDGPIDLLYEQFYYKKL